MDYLPNPVDVEAFVPWFRERHRVEGRFVGFHQTETRYMATFQDDAVAVEYKGSVAVVQRRMAEALDKQD